MEVKRILKDACILLVITLVAGLLLGLAYEITNPVITANSEAKKAASYANVFSEADSFESRDDLLDAAADVLAGAGMSTVEVLDVMAARDVSGNVLGYAMTLSVNGSQGLIEIAYGYGTDGSSMGIDILSSSETPGLGARASEPEFKDQFAGKTVDSFEVTKSAAASDSEIEAISGATITSTAVVNAVNAGIVFGSYCVENN